MIGGCLPDGPGARLRTGISMASQTKLIKLSSQGGGGSGEVWFGVGCRFRSGAGPRPGWQTATDHGG
jgi:hypothetical protein